MNETGKTLEGNKDVWRTWFREFQGTYWTVEENMPETARESWNNFCHYRNNPTPESQDRMKEAATVFKEATGFDAEEVIQFQISLGEK